MSDSAYRRTGELTPLRRRKNLKSEQGGSKVPQITKIELDRLIFFKDHPFKLYEGDQLNEFVHSIEQMGVMQPIHVRHAEDGKYEILSGHNRVNAAKIAGLDAIPAIILDDLSDEDAKIFVIDSNYNQRSKADMRPSEVANSLHMLNEAMKKKSGYRSDMVDVEEGADADSRLRTMEIIGKRYGISQAKVGRYIRIACLIKELQEELDNNKIGMGTAVHLSYLKESEQMIVNALLETNIKISTEQAKALHQASESTNEEALDESMIKKILEPKESNIKVPPIKLPQKFLSKYFDDKQSEEDILDTIAKALELYHSNQN